MRGINACWQMFLVGGHLRQKEERVTRQPEGKQKAAKADNERKDANSCQPLGKTAHLSKTWVNNKTQESEKEWEGGKKQKHNFALFCFYPTPPHLSPSADQTP